MINLHFFLDCRAVGAGAPAPLRLAVSKHSRTAFLTTGVTLAPEEWDAKGQRVIQHPRRKILNSDLARMRAEAEDYLRPMLYNGELADASAQEIRDLLRAHFYGHKTTLKLSEVYLPYAATKGGNTAGIYRAAWHRLLRYKPGAKDMAVEAITPSFIAGFDAYLHAEYKQNTIGSTARCFSAAFNDAISSGRVSRNPFSAIDSSRGDTPSRALSLAQMRALWNATPASEPEALALDFFQLSFLLRAINPTDLLRVGPADINNGRLDYNRQKTGKAISAKIEPEAAAIIERRGDERHLFSYPLSYSALLLKCNKGLEKISLRLGLPKVTMYWARHTLASLLFEQGGSMDIVSAILSHSLGGAKVTATYVAVREARLDAAMRSVIDAVVK